jgi:hypothetical protein
MLCGSFPREQLFAGEALSQRRVGGEHFADSIHHADAFFPALVASFRVFWLTRCGNFATLPSAFL